MIYIGILGFGKLGKYLYENIRNLENYEVSFVWNRTALQVDDGVPAELILHDIEDIVSRRCDLVIEVCHKEVVQNHATFILKYCDLMVGSPTAFCDKKITENIFASASAHAIYIPSGAFWGLEDIRKLNDSNNLKTLKITMEKHPESFKLSGHYFEVNNAAKLSKEPIIIYDGPVKDLCQIAPNNVNTMAAASLAASKLGFEGVIGCLISNSNNTQSHIVTIEVESISGLKVITKRINPAKVGDVTGTATLNSFLSSLKNISGKKIGLNFC